MKKPFYILFFLLTICLSNNVFAYCESDYIRSKASDGSVVILSSGSSWEIDSIDRISSTLWLPMDDVLVCDDGYIIHKDDGEKVGARKIN